MVTIIMNSYNDNQDQLREAICGYQNQKIPCPVEIILSTVANDTSIDTAISMGIEKISISPEKGIFKQLNHAIKFADGHWFCVASGNDKALPNKLIDEHSLLFRTGKLVCYSAFHSTDKDFNITATNKFHPYSYKKHLVGNFVIDNAMVSMEILRKYLPFREEFGNDAFWDMWLRIYEGEGDVFIYNPIPNFLYRLDGNGRHFQKKKNKLMWDEDERNRAKMLASHGAKYRPRKFR